MQETATRQQESLDTSAEPGEIGAVILKVHDACNFLCYPDQQGDSDCYMFKEEKARGHHSGAMTLEIVAKVAERLGEDAYRRNSKQKAVIFHGGEPLLRRPEFFASAMQLFLEALPDSTELNATVESNGTLITDEYLEVFNQFNVRVGISLDGDREANKGRVYVNGRETFDGTMQGIERLCQPRFRHLFAGILAVQHLESDPLQNYTFLKDLLTQGISGTNAPKPVLDFLLPLGGWDEPPYQNEAHRDSRPYATWMFPIVRQWINHDRHLLTLRAPQTIINKLAGMDDGLDALGGAGQSQIVVNSNGTYALTDTILYGRGQTTALPLSVYRHNLDQAAHAAHRRLSSIGALTLADVCKNNCPQTISSVCEGGNVPNRLRNGRYDAPSVLCGDMGRMISDIYGLATALTHDRAYNAAVDGLLPNATY